VDAPDGIDVPKWSVKLPLEGGVHGRGYYDRPRSGKARFPSAWCEWGRRSSRLREQVAAQHIILIAEKSLQAPVATLGYVAGITGQHEERQANHYDAVSDLVHLVK
jgi:hypothetical protein